MRDKIRTVITDVRSWVLGWYHTLWIKYRDPETYHYLCNYQHDPGDYVEAPRPEQL